MSGELSDGWRWAALGDACEIVMGQSPPSSTYRKSPDGIPFYQGKADFGELYPTPRVWCVEPKKVAQVGDVLISVRAPVGPTNVADTECCIGRGLAAVRAGPSLLQDLLFHLLRSSENAIAADGTGSTFNSISGKRLRTVMIPVPPLDEQHRIVAQLEIQLAAAERARRAAKAQLDALDAMPGVLLREIFPRSPSERLPLGWRSVKLGDVCIEERVSIHGDSPEYKSMPYLGLEHIESVTGRILVSESEARRAESKSNNFEFTDKHVLYGKLRPYLNKVALPKFSGRCTTEIIPLKPTVANREWLAWLLRQGSTVDFAMRGKTGSRMPRTSMRDFLQLPVALPPPEEQDRIVLDLQARMAAAQRARTFAKAQLDAANALPAALLRLAFPG